MFLPLLAVLIAGAASAPSSSESTGGAPWVSLSGSGLLTLPDTTTLAPGYWNVDFNLDNQDRDPIRLDVLDVQGAWTYGIRPRLETYGHFVLSRGVAVGDRAILFPPPLDIIIPEGASAPHRPYYTLYDAFPYVSQSGTSRLGMLVPGDGVVGGKWRLEAPRDLRPGLAVTAELKFPLTRDLSNLQSGSGTGGFDQTVRMIAEWRRWRDSLVAGLGLTHVGRPPFGDRLIAFRPGAPGDVTDLPLRLANQVSIGLGLRHVLNEHAALVAEATKVAAVGRHSSAFEAAGPFDVTAGGQLRWGRAHVTLALRYHANSNPHHTAAYPSPLGGLADMTRVDATDLQRYLAAIGAAGAMPHLRKRSHIALAFPAGGPPLPEGARLLPPAYPRHAHDQIGYMLVSGWTFGRSRRASVPMPPPVVPPPAVPLAVAPAALREVRPPFSIVGATIPEMRAALGQGRVTSRDLVLQYLERSAFYEDRLKVAIAMNRDALRQAEELDRERARGRERGPLHGIPVALADDIHTTDMPTTGGVPAFDGLVPPYEATLTKNLREAGAIIIAKTPTDFVSLGAANVGIERAGSMLSLASENGLAAVKPTVGRISRYGVIPITTDQDTPGPLARTVTDAAILLGAMEGAMPDVNDPATATCPPPPRHDYTQFFEAGALNGARIGIPRAFYYDKIRPPGTKEPRGGLSPDQARLMAEAIAILKQQGAVVVDPADIPSVVDKEEKSNLLRRAKDLALAGTHGVDEVMKAQGLDAILFPGASGAAIAAPPGYPTVIVPFGTVPNAPDSSVPDGIAGKPPAFGVSFTGMACSEPRLLALAYAFEQATRRRGPPPSAP